MKFNISISYFIFLAAIYFIYGPKILLCFIISFIFHELGHLIIIKLYKIKITSFSLNIFGGILNVANLNKEPRIDFLVYLFGPLFNLILVLIAYLFNLRKLLDVNLCLFFLNLIPCIPLDGFYILLNFICMHLPFYKSYLVCIIFSIIFSIFLIICGIFINLYTIILGIYFLIYSIFNLKNKPLYHRIIYERLVIDRNDLMLREVNCSIKLHDILYKGKRSYFIINDKVYTDDFFLKRDLKKNYNKV